MKKVIAIAVLAVGVFVWRVGATNPEYQPSVEKDAERIELENRLKEAAQKDFDALDQYQLGRRATLPDSALQGIDTSLMPQAVQMQVENMIKIYDEIAAEMIKTQGAGNKIPYKNAMKELKTLMDEPAQEKDRSESPMQQQIILKMKDGEITIPVEKARHFGVIADMLDSAQESHGFLAGMVEQEANYVPLPKISLRLMKELLADLDFILNIKAKSKHLSHDEMIRQAVDMYQSQIVDHYQLQEVIAFLESLKDREGAVDFLENADLKECYALLASFGFVRKLLSERSMELLSKNNADYIKEIGALSESSKKAVYNKDMPHEIWFEQGVIRQDAMIISAKFSSDGSKVVTASMDGTAKIYAWNGTARVEQGVVRHGGLVRSAVFSSDGNRVVTASVDHTAKIYAWNGTAWVEQGVIRHNSMVNSAVFSSDGNRVVTASEDGTAKMYAWNGTAWVEQGVIEHNSIVNSAVFSPDGTKVVTASADGTAKIYAWNGTAWVEQGVIRHADQIFSAVFSPDGNRVVTASEDGTAKIYVWNGTAWVEQGVIRHDGVVNSAAFSSDGNRVATASDDGTAKIYAWNGTAWIEQGVIRHGGPVHSAVFSSDGNRVVMASYDKMVTMRLMPLKDFEQSLLLELLKWEKARGLAPSWESGWGRGVMNRFSAADRALIKNNFPKTIMQKVQRYFGKTSDQ